MKIKDMRRIVAARQGEMRSLKKQLAEELILLSKIGERISDIEESRTHAQHVIQNIQESVHQQIANIVSGCLAVVFDDPYTFKILFERKRGRTEARCIYERRGRQVDPMGASGGGTVDVSAFALRLASILMKHPQPRKLIIMDEPFKFVSPGFRNNVCRMLEQLVADFGFQFILNTSDQEFMTGKVIQL